MVSTRAPHERVVNTLLERVLNTLLGLLPFFPGRLLAAEVRFVKGGIVPGGRLQFKGNQKKLTPVSYYKGLFDKSSSMEKCWLLLNACLLL